MVDLDLSDDDHWDIESMPVEDPGVLLSRWPLRHVGGMSIEGLVSMARQLHMGVHVDHNGHFWLGFTDQGLHDHTRWQFVLKPDNHRPYLLNSCATNRDGQQRRWAYHADKALARFNEEHGRYERVYPTTRDATRQLLLQNDFAATALMPEAKIFGRMSKVPVCQPQMDLTLLHTALFHESELATVYPETRGLPLNLVLRMHGFGAIVED